ncbi:MULTISPECIES: ABC transporter substrate-binding protein [unclassified Mesorhizobium]|uniref:ABC transporter substrate-binding protein n=1 Tax=unclassified Mesorhizobium TaxID=325217 RepID=UPI00112EE70D|nr:MULTISPECIES: ABC transporter substrate-binding protein [unclassified Mesorhizobium]TPJ39109.1 ABC transporter substrate-binding protein [Mesorhizobium sp. B2-6-6]MCA0000267.1 ABC transporter substrate-binding protein [Mesorhizobium sp. B264B2A]MCA0006319.1 ABC transporter substrate-binding protein [Mesorhizobium sp. B264B1B]MCA0017909.1 ABC transporter substrate-binding protein [Mesorhizobium sp. B264B1A]TPJ53856.1 ABC transporter substrate-binding protein [Mesorhizobium sp. B2-6-7]
MRKVILAVSVGLLAVTALVLGRPTVALADDAITASVKTDPALHAMLPKSIQDSGIIKLATDAHYPPCESFAEDNVTMIGWEPDLWDALAKKLGVKVKAESINFDGLIPGVQSGRYDTAMECISDTVEREKQVTFVDLSISINGIFTLENSAITDNPLSLCGLKSGAQKGTTFVQSIKELLSPLCVKNGKAPIATNEFASADATILALLSGRVDFLVNDASAAAFIKKQSSQPVKLIVLDVLPKQIDGFIVKKDNTELANALLAGTKALMDERVYDRIMDKWDIAALKLKTPGINLVSKGATAN